MPGEAKSEGLDGQGVEWESVDDFLTRVLGRVVEPGGCLDVLLDFIPDGVRGGVYLWPEGGDGGANAIEGATKMAGELSEGKGARAVCKVVEVGDEVARVSGGCWEGLGGSFSGELVAFCVNYGVGVEV